MCFFLIIFIFSVEGVDPPRRRRREEERRRAADDRAGIEELRRRLRITGPIRDRYLPMPSGTGPIILGQPTAGTSGAAAVAGKAKDSKIVIKQAVKQIVNERTRRRTKAVKESTKSALKSKKSEYTKLKKQLKKNLTAGKKQQYSRENEAIKKLPKSARVQARKNLRGKLKAKQQVLLKQLPSTGRMKYSDVQGLIHRIKKLKW